MLYICSRVIIQPGFQTDVHRQSIYFGRLIGEVLFELKVSDSFSIAKCLPFSAMSQYNGPRAMKPDRVSELYFHDVFKLFHVFR